MKLVSTFHRRLKTSRALVFENIMDLDHVCVVHRRWFSNLRALARRPDFVEYRMTSHFYGLRQPVTARGGTVDGNRYWYEFLTPLAQMRVDGMMEGTEGDLALTETITYNFPPPLAPVFWLLRPVFKRQKQDILRDDSRLLEREYELSQTGFERLSSPPQRPRVVVFGGNGFFGREAVEDLLCHTEAEVVVAGRRIGKRAFHPFESRVVHLQSDLDDFEATCRAIEGAAVAINCVGPFQGQSLNLLRACIQQRVHYVDVADDRDFVMRCHALAGEIEKAGIAAFVGCSVVPGISSLLTRYCLQRAGAASAESVRVFITPGTRHPRGPGSFQCLLSTVGREISILRRGHRESVMGWSGREKVRFPVGDRWVYFVVDVADYELHPRQFGATTVEFKIGSEFDFLNRSLEALRWLGPRRLESLVPLSRGMIGIFSWFGTTRGAVMVEVQPRGGTDTTRMSVYAANRGEIIPALLPSIATQMLLTGEIKRPGIVPLADWLPEERFASELAKRSVQIEVVQ